MNRSIVLQPSLTHREQQILALLADDYTTRELAAMLFISFDTVKTHRQNLSKKLSVKTTGGMVSKGFRLGLIPK